MAGHNKWSKIKRKKGVTDARRSKEWSRILKEINVAVKEGGPSPEGNARLRLALNNARGANMPKDNIQRALAKASDKDSANYSEVTYEGYGPNGIAVFIECTTDNINRTVADIRHVFSKYGGSLGTSGSLSFVFDRKGIFIVPQGSLNEEDFMMEVIDAGAEDTVLEDERFEIITSFEDFGPMQKKLEEMGVEVEKAELQRIPRTTTALDVGSARQVLNIIEKLEELDDVQSVYHNLEMTAELEEAL